jgi:hypothetical protein
VLLNLTNFLSVSDGTGSSEFEMIAKFPFDVRRRTLTLRSDSTSEKLVMYLKRSAVNQAQNAFNGARCAFEVKRSKEDEIEVYSSRLQYCGSTDDYDVFPYFRVTVQKDGKFVSSTDVTGPKPRYLDFSDDDISGPHGPNVTINRASMMEENALLKGIDFHVLVFEGLGQKDICGALSWRSEII